MSIRKKKKGKYKFSLIERHVIFSIYNGKCFYTRKRLEFNNFHIDHIIPEDYLEKEEEFDKLRNDYQIFPEFSINSYYNWVPTLPPENLRKSKITFNKSTVLYYLELIKSKVPKLLELEKKCIEDQNKDKILAKLGIKLKQAIITKQEVIDFMERLFKFDIGKHQSNFEYFLKKLSLLSVNNLLPIVVLNKVLSMGGFPYRDLMEKIYQNIEDQVFEFIKNNFNKAVRNPSPENPSVRHQVDFFLNNKDKNIAFIIKVYPRNNRQGRYIEDIRRNLDIIISRTMRRLKIDIVILLIFCNRKLNIDRIVKDYLLEEKDFEDNELNQNLHIKRYILNNFIYESEIIIWQNLNIKIIE